MKITKKIFIWISFFVFLIIKLIFGKQGLYNLWQLKKEESLYIKRVNEINNQNIKLMREVQRLRYDPEYVEALIKKDLKVIRNNEIIIYFKE